MTRFEKIRKNLLVFGLAEPFEVYFTLIPEIKSKFDIKDNSMIRKRTLELIEYLLDSGDFIIGIQGGLEFEPWNLSNKESILKVKNICDQVGNDTKALAKKIWLSLRVLKG